MSKSFQKQLNDIDSYFESPPSLDVKAWNIVNKFYHMILTHMETNNIKKVDLASELNISRSAVTQMLDGNPSNITIKKMVETADAVGLELDFNIDNMELEIFEQAEINTQDEFRFALVRPPTLPWIIAAHGLITVDEDIVEVTQQNQINEATAADYGYMASA